MQSGRMCRRAIRPAVRLSICEHLGLDAATCTDSRVVWARGIAMADKARPMLVRMIRVACIRVQHLSSFFPQWGRHFSDSFAMRCNSFTTCCWGRAKRRPLPRVGYTGRAGLPSSEFMWQVFGPAYCKGVTKRSSLR